MIVTINEEEFYAEFIETVAGISTEISKNISLQKACRNDKEISFVVYTKENKEMQAYLRQLYYDAISTGITDCAQRYIHAISKDEKFVPSNESFLNGVMARAVNRHYLKEKYPDAFLVKKDDFAIILTYQIGENELLLSKEDMMIYGGNDPKQIIYSVLARTLKQFTFNVTSNERISSFPFIKRTKVFRFICKERPTYGAIGMIQMAENLFRHIRANIYILPFSTSSVYAISGVKEDEARKIYNEYLQEKEEDISEEERLSHTLYLFDKNGLHSLG